MQVSGHMQLARLARVLTRVRVKLLGSFRTRIVVSRLMPLSFSGAIILLFRSWFTQKEQLLGCYIERMGWPGVLHAQSCFLTA